MFQILCDPSSGSTELCLTEITRSDSTDILSCAWSVFGSVNFEPVVYVYGTASWEAGRTIHTHHSNFNQAQLCTP
jgi:hypothetical protein